MSKNIFLYGFLDFLKLLLNGLPNFYSATYDKEFGMQ